MKRPFDYHLPDDKIALYPADERTGSKLLVYVDNNINDRMFAELPKILPKNSIIIRNSSKVIQSRLHLKRATGALMEVFCLEVVSQSQGEAVVKCMIRNVRKLKVNEILSSNNKQYPEMNLTAQYLTRDDEHSLVAFRWQPSHFDFFDVLDRFGEIPLPPYIQRKSAAIDRQRYQTVYASQPGSVAAPTAGLHFSETLEEELKQNGHTLCSVILHVGAGTFKPMKSDNIHEHIMHSEYFSVDTDTIQLLANHATPIVCVGTTTLRTLESLYIAGHFITENTQPHSITTEQFDAEKINHFLPPSTIWKRLLDLAHKYNTNKIAGNTSLMITPQHICRTVDYLITNFHQPNSTLLLIVASFIGDNWKNVYHHALQNNYRFLSYGDACFFKNMRLENSKF